VKDLTFRTCHHIGFVIKLQIERERIIMITREEIINSDRTLECPECGYILIGFNPVEYILCDPCYKKEKEKGLL